MSNNHKSSPAVESLRKERAAQAGRDVKADLDNALKDSFPASDPISMTSTSIPVGRTDAESAERVRANPDPAAKAVEMAQETRSVLGDAGKLITEKPIAAATAVAAFAYLFGVTR
jgi:hypothetical protein